MRSIDDPQPYVVFDADEIRNAPVATLDEFFKTRLPMNTTQTLSSQDITPGLGAGNRSSINLRGLGTNQTLILVNGRRMPQISELGRSGGFGQPDINGIPLSAIERIEVLPSTASGIYGGGATGGVINIVLRQDYDGADLSLEYGDTFDQKASYSKIDFSAGLSLEQGRTDVLFTASYASSDQLLVGERGFAENGRLLASEFIRTLGIPVIGSSTNILSIDGQDLILDNGTDLGATNTFVPAGYEGPESDDGEALTANAGMYNLQIPDGIPGLRQSLVNEPEIKSASLAVRREFSDSVEAYFDVLTTSNRSKSNVSVSTNSGLIPGDAPSNPFQNFILVFFPQTSGPNPENVTTTENWRASVGAIFSISESWSGALDYTWNRSRIETIATNPGTNIDAFNAAVSSGSIDVFRDLDLFPIDYSPFLLPSPNQIAGPTDVELENLSLRVAGPLFDIGGGSVAFTGLLERRDEVAKDSFRTFPDFFDPAQPDFRLDLGRKQVVDSLYAEAVFPFVGAENGRAGIREFELQASVRHDRYQTDSPSEGQFGIPLDSLDDPKPEISSVTNKIDSTDYTLAVRYAPVQGVALRGSFGTGFLPASIDQITRTAFPTLDLPPSDTLVQFFADPKRDNVFGPQPIGRQFFGGSPDLLPEESESWSIGLVATPDIIPGLRISIDFTRIQKTNEIVAVPSADDLLQFEDRFSERIVRGPLTPEDELLGYSAGPVLSLDFSLINAARTDIEAIDYQVNFARDLRKLGELEFYAVATQQTKLRRQTFPSADFVESVGFSGGPLEWRGNVGANWMIGPWRLAWNMQYFDSYLLHTSDALQPTIDFVTSLQGGTPRVSSQTYHDLAVRYRWADNGPSLLSDTELSLSVRNVFDKSPPTIGGIPETGGYSTYGDPRLRSFSITLRKSF